jgi:hypothetical protein
MPPSAASTSLRQRLTQVRALSPFVPRRRIFNAILSASATPTPPPANRIASPTASSSTNFPCKNFKRAVRFFRGRGAALAPVSSTRSTPLPAFDTAAATMAVAAGTDVLCSPLRTLQ